MTTKKTTKPIPASKVLELKKAAIETGIVTAPVKPLVKTPATKKKKETRAQRRKRLAAQSLAASNQIAASLPPLDEIVKANAQPPSTAPMWLTLGLAQDILATDPIKLSGNRYAETARLICLRFIGGKQLNDHQHAMAVKLYAKFLQLESHPNDLLQMRRCVVHAVNVEMMECLNADDVQARQHSARYLQSLSVAYFLTCLLAALGEAWFKDARQSDLLSAGAGWPAVGAVIEADGVKGGQDDQ